MQAKDLIVGRDYAVKLRTHGSGYRARFLGKTPKGTGLRFALYRGGELDLAHERVVFGRQVRASWAEYGVICAKIRQDNENAAAARHAEQAAHKALAREFAQLLGLRAGDVSFGWSGTLRIEDPKAAIAALRALVEEVA